MIESNLNKEEIFLICDLALINVPSYIVQDWASFIS